MGTVVSTYRGKDSACFGELALMYVHLPHVFFMACRDLASNRIGLWFAAHCSFCNLLANFRYNKPRQASVRAVTDGSLWALSREAFRSVLLAKFTHQSALKLMRTLDVLSKFSLQQLHRLADSMVEFKFRDGDVIIEKVGSSFHGPRSLCRSANRYDLIRVGGFAG